MPGVRVLGEPEATLVAFTFDDADTFAVGDAPRPSAAGCSTSRQPPPSLHCTVNAVHAGVIPEFLAALRVVLDAVRGHAGAQRAYGVAEWSVATHRVTKRSSARNPLVTVARYGDRDK